jgi:hypothetical protein
MHPGKVLVGIYLVLVAAAAPAAAQGEDASCRTGRATLDELWWPGPMLANSAATLPRGHVLFEPYIYDVATASGHGFGSRSYLLYGATNRLTVGLIPVLGFTAPHDGPSSSRIGFGDLTFVAQYGLTSFHAGGRMPAMAVMVQETLPTGRYDRLADRPSDGFGGGAYRTTVGFNAQTYVWLPTGRALRMRLNVSDAFSRHASIEGVSVYGTANGFRGTAAPGNAAFVDASFEYSAARRVALATDVFYSGNGNTRVSGTIGLSPEPASTYLRDSGVSRAIGVAPAVELSVSRNLGVLLGVRVIPGQRTSRSITPAIAINFVH